MTEINQFLNGGLKAYLPNEAPLQVIFWSTRGLSSHKAGKVETNKDNLSIEVFGDFNLPSFVALDLMVFGRAINDDELSDIGVEIMQDEALVQHDKTVSSFQEKFEVSAELLFFVYISLSAFEADIENILQIEKTYPNAQIIALTCDCDQSIKEKKLQPLIDNGSIDEVVVTPYCGGQSSMSTILDKVIEIF